MTMFPRELLQWFLISRGFPAHRHTNAGSPVFLLKNLITRWCRKEFTAHKWGKYCLAMHNGSHLAVLMTWQRLIKDGSGAPMKVSRSKLSHPPRPHEIRYIHGLIFPSTCRFRFIRSFHIQGAHKFSPKCFNVKYHMEVGNCPVKSKCPGAAGVRYEVPDYVCKITL